MGETQIWNNQSNERSRIIQPPQRMTAIMGTQERRSTDNTVNVVVVDRSKSTKDAISNTDNRRKLDGIKEATTQFITNVPRTAYISVMTFHDSAKSIWDMSPVEQNKLHIIKAIQGIPTGESTQMIVALMLAEKQLQKAPSNFFKRLYLLTDGLPNDNPTAQAEKLKAQNVQISTIGFGEGYQIDEDLLRNMASKSKTGNPLYYHFKNLANLTGFFRRESITKTF